MTFDPNDPKWTAYALGEGTPAERAACAAEEAANPAVAAHLADIRRTAAQLEAAFAAEPEPGLEPARRAAVQAAARRPAGRLLGFPLWTWAGVGAAAAALMLAVVGLREAAPRATGEAEIAVGMSRSEPVTMGGEWSKNAPVDLTVRETEALEEALVVNERLDGIAPSLEMDTAQLVQEAPVTPVVPSPEWSLGAAMEDASASDVASAEFGGRALTEGVRSRKTVGLVAAPAMAPLGYGVVEDAPQPALGYGVVEDAPQPAWGPSLDDFAPIRANTFQRVADHPLSTFSIDVDTASYSVVRKFLEEGSLPPPDAVRIEELVNYFPYDYAPPVDGRPFAAHLAAAPCPWNPAHRLVRVALKGKVIDAAERPPLNLVYLLDVSGSMNAPNKLPLVVRSMQALVNQLDGRDRVAIVVYAGAAGLVLPPTSGAEPEAIRAALERLQAGGSTDGAGGIELAYQVAREHFATGAVNRVILCTDGDFNVGTVQRGDLERLIEREAASGVFLTVLGFGMGNYKDGTLELLSNKGNGNYAYIDDFREARKVLVDELLGTMVTIAKDVKIQVEFNPAVVAGYRLIGYENRMLKKEDFNNDRVDAGEIGAGHTVTALYELVPAGRPVPEAGEVDALKYQPVAAERVEPAAFDRDAEALTVKLRYKEPEGDVSSKLEFPLAAATLEHDAATADFRFAASVAGFGLLLRGPDPIEGFAWSDVLALAEGARGEDRLGHRAAFLDLVRTARAIAGE